MKLPEKKYAVIYADPPWSYRQHGTGPKSRGNAAQHYHTMTVEDICALPVRQLAGGGQGCALFMWATFPTIPDALKVMDAWGFTYKTAAFVWIKKYKSGGNFYGMGAYTRANAEVCLLGVTPGFKAKAFGVRPVLCFSSALLVSVEDEREAGFSLSDVPLDDLLAEIKSRTEG